MNFLTYTLALHLIKLHYIYTGTFNCQMIVGYARVSKQEQNYNLQVDEFKKLGCNRIFIEKVSGAAKERPEFQKMLHILRPGDTVVVWDTSRLGRTMIEMVLLVERWIKEGIQFKSIQEPFIDTTTEMGEMIFKFFSVLAEGERKRIIRRTKEGIAAAKARGRIGGRPKGLTEKAKSKASTVAILYKEGKSINEIREHLGIGSNTTIYNYLRHEGIEIDSWRGSRHGKLG